MTDGVEGRETDRARLAGLEHREIRERDPDPLGELREREAPLVQHVIQSHEDRHRQTVAASSSRMREPSSNTRASTKSSRIASHEVIEKLHWMSSGCPVVRARAATSTMTMR